MHAIRAAAPLFPPHISTLTGVGLHISFHDVKTFNTLCRSVVSFTPNNHSSQTKLQSELLTSNRLKQIRYYRFTKCFLSGFLSEINHEDAHRAVRSRIFYFDGNRASTGISIRFTPHRRGNFAPSLTRRQRSPPAFSKFAKSFPDAARSAPGKTTRRDAEVFRN